MDQQSSPRRSSFNRYGVRDNSLSTPSTYGHYSSPHRSMGVAARTQQLLQHVDQSSTYPSTVNKDATGFGTQPSTAISDDMSNLNDLTCSMSEMKNINSSTSKNQHLSSSSLHSSSDSCRSTFNRSVSASSNLSNVMEKTSGSVGNNGMFLKRHETIPTEGSQFDAVDILANNGASVIECDSSITGGGSSGGNSDSDSLTSPNLVSSMKTSSPLLSHTTGNIFNNNNSNGLQRNQLATRNNSSSFSHHQERKTSITSSNYAMSSDTSEKALSGFESQEISATAAAASANADDTCMVGSTTKSRMGRTTSASVVAAAKHSSTSRRQLNVGTEVISSATSSETSSALMTEAKISSASTFSSENIGALKCSQRQSKSSLGGSQYTSSHSTSKSSKLSSSRFVSSSSSLLSSSKISELINRNMSKEELEKSFLNFEDLEEITQNATINNVQDTLIKYCGVMTNSMEAMKNDEDEDSLSTWTAKLNKILTKTRCVPTFGFEMGNTLCSTLMDNGGFDLLIQNCSTNHNSLQFNSAQLLQQCLINENKDYIVEKGLDNVVALAKKYTGDIGNINESRVGTGIFEHLFRHSESTCGNIIALGGLDTVVNECKSADVETLRHCASALANVAIYGGSENHEAMIQRNVHAWLFPLAFNKDDTVKYYACLAIAVLVANKEMEAEVQKSGVLELIEPFIKCHSPAEFARVFVTHRYRQCSKWLKRLVPVLTSQREEARCLAAFHFCMEAEIRRQNGDYSTDFFYEIGVVDSLKNVASCPNKMASRLSIQTLRLIGEELPHKLSQQVPTWSIDDVQEWLKQIGFSKYLGSFSESRVDGDLLLQVTDETLRDDMKILNGMLRRRFMRELNGLKRVTDYSSCDKTNLNGFLQSLGSEYSVYTYNLLNAGIDRDTLLIINDDKLLVDSGITHKIHRWRIQQGVKIERGDFSPGEDQLLATFERGLDVFISYRHATGSQLASLLKVHLEIRKFSVFLDVDRLEAGKFDNNLLKSIRGAKNFVLVLSPSSLDRCFGDTEMCDWIHKEVACALQAKCNIIPILDNFIMPPTELLPETMRAVTTYNGVKWIHDYQEACVDKVDRFIRGDGTTNL